MSKTFRVNIASEEIDDFTQVCLKAGWAVLDTGERVATDDGDDAEAVLLLSVLAEAKAPEARALTVPL